MTRTTTGQLQRRAWQFYGYPGSEWKAVGEVRYVVGWLADQMSRLEWDVLIDGSDNWTVTLPDTVDEKGKPVPGGTISTTQENGEQDLTAASTQLLELIDWDDTNIRAITTNLFVGGEGTYARLDDRWQVVSPIDPDKRKKLQNVEEQVPFLWPHPADPTKPDAPLFGVLNLLDEMDWLNRQSRAQSRQRVLINGILATASSFNGPNGATFWDTWNEAMSVKMEDPDDLSPVRLQGELADIKDGLNWVVPPFGYDDVLDRRVTANLERMAYGLPIPKEILLGMQAASRATAFQIEESGYRAHIEPPGMMVAQVGQDALTVLLEAVEVTVVPNPSKLLARKNSVQDVKDAYDRGLVTTEYIREVLGIPEDAAPDPEKDGIPPGQVGMAPTDPANVAADEPVTASRGVDLSSLLADIDTALSSELAGATVMATDRARQRLGAAARQKANGAIPGVPDYKGLPNATLAVRLGYDGLRNLGVDVADQIAEPIDAASRWWVRRVGEVWAQTAELIPGWSGQGDWISESVEVLATSLTEHIVDTLSEIEPPPLVAGSIREVVDVAAGGKIAA